MDVLLCSLVCRQHEARRSECDVATKDPNDPMTSGEQFIASALVAAVVLVLLAAAVALIFPELLPW
jgi:hypothetical protein